MITMEQSQLCVFNFGREQKLVLVPFLYPVLAGFWFFVFHFSQKLETEKTAEVKPQLFFKAFHSTTSGFLIIDYLKMEVIRKHTAQSLNLPQNTSVLWS